MTSFMITEKVDNWSSGTKSDQSSAQVTYHSEPERKIILVNSRTQSKVVSFLTAFKISHGGLLYQHVNTIMPCTQSALFAPQYHKVNSEY